MNIGVVNVIHLLKKEGRSRIKILTGDPVLNGMWKSKHHTWLLRHFSQVLDSLGKFGTRMIPTLTIRKWRYDSRTPVPWHTTGIGHPTCTLGGVEEGYRLWAHEIQGFKSLFSSSETFGFQLCLPKTSQELPTMLSHMYCFTALFLQLQAIQNYWMVEASLWTSYQRRSVHLPARQTVLHFKIILTELRNLFKDWSITYAHPWRLCGCLKISKRN